MQISVAEIKIALPEKISVESSQHMQISIAEIKIAKSEKV
jgi:hypothetical protein